MKMVKSLLLGTAAGLVAMTGAQAADLPVKAKPVQYVKICSLYGAGFYYIPGTDMCIKLGGFVRTELDFNAAGSFVPFVGNNQGRYTRNDNHGEAIWRNRAAVSLDVREQTEYGTLRSYLRGGWQSTTGDDYTVSLNSQGGAGNVFYDRAFIQFAGFTVGRAVSFFDIFSPTPSMSLLTNHIGSVTGGIGIQVWAYTAQFGNGISASISAEDRGGRPVVNVSTATFGVGLGLTNSTQANTIGVGLSPAWPDIVGNIRADQTWGSVGVSGAIHDVAATYYTPTATGAAGGTASGYPSDKIGWAIGVGGVLNVPWSAGDTVGVEFDIARGAGQYTGGITASTANVGLFQQGGVGLGWSTDAIFTSAGGVAGGVSPGLQLTDSWAFMTGYNHKWNKQWQTSLYGGYLKESYNSTATAAICGSAGIAATFGGTVTAGNNCSPNFQLWQIGSRTLWNPTPNLDIGLDVVYSNVNTAFSGATVATANGAQPAGRLVKDTHVVSALFRLQRNFVP